MKNILFAVFVFTGLNLFGQDQKIIDAIILEATENSQLESLAHHLTDRIGPRLVGTPEMKQANDWVVSTYQSWGIDAQNEQFGTWRGWQRGPTHVEMISPRNIELTGRQLAWSPSTKKPVEAEVVAMPLFSNKTEFGNWGKTVKGKIVLISNPPYSGRPESNWKEFATEAVFEAYKSKKEAYNNAWRASMDTLGFSASELVKEIENLGAVGLISTSPTNSWGATRVFGTSTKKIPEINLNPEDYGMIYRLAKNGAKPIIKIEAESKSSKPVPTYNTIGEIRGSEKPDEYVYLSAHLDSWDAGTGATDNATGTILMMEVMRILK